MKGGIFLEIFSVNLLIALTAGVTSKTGVIHVSKDYLCGDFETLFPNITTW